jgi:hypothetical protein
MYKEIAEVHSESGDGEKNCAHASNQIVVVRHKADYFTIFTCY